MHEFPDRAVIDRKAACGKFSDQSAQSEVLLRALQQPSPVLARNRLRLVAAHLAGCDAAGLAQASYPGDGGIHPNPKLLRRPVAGQPTLDYRRNHPLAQINRIRLAHPMLASCPASTVNQKQRDLGILNRIKLNSSRSSKAIPQETTHVDRSSELAEPGEPGLPRSREPGVRHADAAA